eukprot:2583618-Pleurochrysis_carterae.AAC.2
MSACPEFPRGTLLNQFQGMHSMAFFGISAAGSRRACVRVRAELICRACAASTLLYSDRSREEAEPSERADHSLFTGRRLSCRLRLRLRSNLS